MPLGRRHIRNVRGPDTRYQRLTCGNIMQGGYASIRSPGLGHRDKSQPPRWVAVVPTVPGVGWGPPGSCGGGGRTWNQLMGCESQ